MSDDWIEEMLEEQPDTLPDQGFTERVMGALPPRRRRLRRPILLVSGLLAAVVGVWLLPGGALLQQSVHQVTAYGQGGGELPLVPLVVLGALIWGAAAAARAEG